MDTRQNPRRIFVIAGIGLIACIAAAGVRVNHRKPIHGTWIGYMYQEVDGKLVADREFGKYVIEILPNGKYRENGNSTSGKWTRIGNQLKLIPTHIMDATPAQLRDRFRKKSGELSSTMENLIKLRMQPMVVTYHQLADRMVYKEPTLHFEYERL